MSICVVINQQLAKIRHGSGEAIFFGNKILSFLSLFLSENAHFGKGSITVRQTSSFNDLDLVHKYYQQIYFFGSMQSSQTGGQSY